jgi:hypothetical protein
MSERVQEYIDQMRRQETERAERERRAQERDGCTHDAVIIRWDDPERSPWIA